MSPLDDIVRHVFSAVVYFYALFPPLPYVGEINLIFESEFTVTSSVQRISSCTDGKRRKIHPFMKLCSKAKLKLKIKREFIVGLFFFWKC